MGAKYTTNTISGYNVTPPSDDGTKVSDNQVNWAKHKTKLGDPLKTLAEAINSSLVNLVNEGPDTKTSAYTTVASDHNKIIECSGTFTVSLLDASTGLTGYRVIVKNNGSGTITVDTDTAGDKIDGEASVPLKRKDAGRFVVASGAGAYYREFMSVSGFNAIQSVITQDGAVDTGTTVMVLDDTIPQNDEGDEYMTQAITPTDTLNTLLIEARFVGSNTAGGNIIVALFQDSVADALKAVGHAAAGTGLVSIDVSHEVAAGTTSELTMKIRAGAAAAGTTTFNGTSGSRQLGGVMGSFLKITEIQT